MRRRVLSIGLALLGAVWVAALLNAQAPAQPQAPATPVSFSRDILPVMEASCLACHGADTQLGRLDLRTRESALTGGARGAAIVPGNAEQSRLYRFVAGLERHRMPMSGDAAHAGADRRVQEVDRPGRELGWRRPQRRPPAPRPPARRARAMEITAEQRNYWAFKLPVQAPLPVVADKDLTNPIDRFLEKARVERGLKAAPRADRFTLVRRAYLDLLGLPPTPAQVAAFMADQTPQALGAPDRHAARLAALRRALRPALARRGALRRLRRLRVRRPSAQRVALSRLRDQVVQRGQAVQPVPHRADRRRRDGLEDRRQADRHRVPAHGTARAVPREGQSRSAATTTSTRSSARSARARWG